MPVDTRPVRPEWFAALLEEYKSLRTEALTARDAQLSILRVAVPLLAALIGLGVSVSLKDKSAVGGLVLSVSVPLVVALTFEMWNAEVKRSVRAGSFVAAIEHRLGDTFDRLPLDWPVAWESWLRRNSMPPHGEKVKRSRQQRDSAESAAIIFIFLLVVAFISYALGLYFLVKDDHATVALVTGGVMLAGFVAMPVRAVRVAKGIERLNEIPDPSEIWRTAQPPS